MKLLVLSDSHVGSAREYQFRGFKPAALFEAVLGKSDARSAGCLLHLGDICGDKNIHADSACYDLAKNLWRDVPCPKIFVGGNHDDTELCFELNVWPSSVTPEVFRSSNGPQFQLSLGPYSLIGLNIATPRERGTTVRVDTLEWLRRQFDTLTGRALVMIHHPILPSGCEWMDRTMGISNWQELHSIFRANAHSIAAVLHGHLHHARVTDCDNVKYVSVPSTMFQFATTTDAADGAVQNSPPGFTTLTLEDDAVSVEFTFL